MTATTEPPAGGGPLEPASGSASSSGAPAAGTTLIGPSSSYLCANCSAELAVDQHYCVECGARRGRPRFSLATSGGGAGTDVTGLVAVAPAGALALKGGGLPPRLTLMLATIVVLLAVGVGVLIGESGNTVKVDTVKVSTVTVAGGASVATGPGVTGSSTAGSGTAPKTATTSGTSSTSSTKSSTSGSGSGNFFGN